MECKECRAQVNFVKARYKSCTWSLESSTSGELKYLMFPTEPTTNTRVRIQSMPQETEEPGSVVYLSNRVVAGWGLSHTLEPLAHIICWLRRMRFLGFLPASLLAGVSPSVHTVFLFRREPGSEMNRLKYWWFWIDLMVIRWKKFNLNCFCLYDNKSSKIRKSENWK